MPANDDITRQLAQMLGQGDSEDQDAEREPGAAPPARPPLVADNRIAGTGTSRALRQRDARINEGGYPAGGYPAGQGFSPTREQAADDPSAYYGRGPTGRLRNFRAMNDGKLTTTYRQVAYEGNDAEALAAIRAEAASRGLVL